MTAGYNFQCGNFVYGLEADFQGVFGTRTFASHNFYDLTTVFGDSARFGTIRARAGIASGATLFYLTAGVAAVNAKLNRNRLLRLHLHFVLNSNWEWAAVIGAGIEHQLGGGWSAKVEGLYIPQGQDRRSRTVRHCDPVRRPVRQRSDIAVIRFGVNYRFGALRRPRSWPATDLAE